MMPKRALSINCGSSSLKYALFEMTGGKEDVVERRVVTNVEDHAQAVFALLSELAERSQRPDVVGHRIVHGGANFTRPTRIDAKVLAALDELVPLAPLHLPTELRVIRAVADRWPNVPQVACFDTAFHRSMPEVAQRYALPSASLGLNIRRYGFHGLSYEYVVGALGKDLRRRTIIAHLGSGASMVAVRDGRAIETTMGFSPTGGLVMGTRPGDLDPGVILYLLGHGTSPEALDRILQHESGLLALSETTPDMRKLLALRDTDPRAAFAIDVFCASARKWIGALAAAQDGIDALIFTGGVGENAAPVRAQIAHGLTHLGVEIDDVKNARNDEGRIGVGTCDVRVVRTDEERIVARHAFAVV